MPGFTKAFEGERLRIVEIGFLHRPDSPPYSDVLIQQLKWLILLMRVPYILQIA